MKILITGTQGMLGTELVTKLSKEFDIYGMVRRRDPNPHFFECDITNRTLTINAIERVMPHLVIHAAAMTDVDGCEADRLKAMKVNFEGTKHVVDGTRHVKALLIYISTDFVFSGSQPEPYREINLPHPLNVYGETKLLGEFYVREQSANYLILRTAWLFGKHGTNFMSKILKKAKEAQELRVVNDQRGTPTYAVDLASAIHHVVRFVEKAGDAKVLNSIYHVTNRGAATRFEVACELIKQVHLDRVKITPIDSSEVRSLAKRPANSVLDSSRFEKIFGFTLRPWQEALADYLKEIQCHEQETPTNSI